MYDCICYFVLFMGNLTQHAMVIFFSRSVSLLAFVESWILAWTTNAAHRFARYVWNIVKRGGHRNPFFHMVNWNPPPLEFVMLSIQASREIPIGIWPRILLIRWFFIYNDDPMTYWICTVCNKALFSCNHIEDNDKLISYLSEIWIVTLKLNLADLREKIYNTFEFNCEDQSSPLWDSDPGIHYYNLICNDLASCDYYLEDAFKCDKMW